MLLPVFSGRIGKTRFRREFTTLHSPEIAQLTFAEGCSTFLPSRVSRGCALVDITVLFSGEYSPFEMMRYISYICPVHSDVY